MTEVPTDHRPASEVVPELLAQAELQPHWQLASGHHLMAYRSPNTGCPVLGFGLTYLYPSTGEVELLLRLLGWEGARTQKGAAQKHGCWWVFIEPPA
ncbi:hypothetical protein [Deinococcus sp. SL84]|uniref:hypothetical protein n=1 Tax=Deinococcus sp. SL84 TaxID=2994663 RepID=UPI002272B77F|nr:hypothetical protein [Deinococcus sp. SL84]MCY1703561.1 hypothetical protein [Deinococcus sp. SL84]